LGVAIIIFINLSSMPWTDFDCLWMAHEYIYLSRFPSYIQLDAMDCGPTCLRMIAAYYGRNFSLKTLRTRSFITRQGVSMLGISDAAESVGLRATGVRLSFEQLRDQARLPCIVHWKQNHFAVVWKIHSDRSWFGKSQIWVYVADPARGHVRYRAEEFLKGWISTRKDGECLGHCLLLEPTPAFYHQQNEPRKQGQWNFLWSYLRPYKSLMVQLALGFLVTSAMSLAVPFLTQAMVDKGIHYKDPSLLVLILVGQLALTLGSVAVGFIRGWLMLHLSTRINISIVSDFLVRLMRLPMQFFDSKMTGDLLQRIGDNRRIQEFLTHTALNVVFAGVSFVVFGCIIAWYSWIIFALYMAGSALYVLWISVFLKYRRDLDNRRFAESSVHQNSLIQLITGMPEIKLNQCEQVRRWEWERIQAQLFRLGMKGLMVGQYQTAGAALINGIKNFTVTYLAARAVIDGQMTLGMMLSVQYIIGQLNGPVDSMIGFMQNWQDARLSLERLNEVGDQEAEGAAIPAESPEVPLCQDIVLRNVSFQYEGPRSPYALHEVSMCIRARKVTAVVGASGSGKTTLLKLLLGFYTGYSGEILAGDVPLSALHPRAWRQHTGAVLQDGFLFYDTIARNIAVSSEEVDEARLLRAAEVAQIREYIGSLPMGFNTRIGSAGRGISQGQRQRILIARVVYKDPEYVFLDEATNALDARNERMVMEGLQEFFKNRTVLVAAHRLSTVRQADHIVVLDEGRLVEQGRHEELVRLGGTYYGLVKNQLELGT